MKLKLLLISAFVFIVSCDNSSEKLVPNIPRDRVVNKGDKVTNPAIDILFVVDDSGSMGTHQSNLSKNITYFIDEIQKIRTLDYRIAVTTSTYDSRMNGPAGQDGWFLGQPNYVDRNTPNADDEIKKRLKVGTSGSTYEVFLDPVQAAFSQTLLKGPNAGFLRSDAYLAIIFLTDAEDLSDATPEDVFKDLTALKSGEQRRVLSYGAIIPSNSTTNCSRDGNYPVKLEKFINLAGGSYFDLCDQEFGKHLVAIARNVVNRIGGEILLAQRPKVETILVTFGSQTIPNHPKRGWVYSERTNSIFFGDELELKPEPSGTEISVDFQPR